MLRYLLDTDTCVDYLRARHPVANAVRTHRSLSAISCVTLGELAYGAACTRRAADKLQDVTDFACSLVVVPLGWEVAVWFGRLKCRLRSEGALIPDFDLIIAASALAHDLTLVTSNTSHFLRIPNLRVENWRDE